MIVSEARTLAVKELLPVMKTGDVEGCRYENGRVKMPDAFRRAWYLLEKGGWFAPCQNPEWGGRACPTASMSWPRTICSVPTWR